MSIHNISFHGEIRKYLPDKNHFSGDMDCDSFHAVCSCIHPLCSRNLYCVCKLYEWYRFHLAHSTVCIYPNYSDTFTLYHFLAKECAQY